MKIRLKKGKQTELIIKAKKGLTWKQLSKKLNINEAYLRWDIKKGRRLISKERFIKLNKLVEQDFTKYIEKELKKYWGQSKGGLNSSGSTIKIPEIKLDEKLSEFVGAVLGDGHICYYKSSNNKRKIGVYCIRITGDLIKDKEYHLYLKNLSESIFKIKAKSRERPKGNERFLNLISKELVNFFINMGIKPGNKIINQSTIPNWIFENDFYLKTCLRGLIDTDGSVHRMSKRDPNLIRINFTNHNITLLRDTRKAFIQLGFNPSKIINNRQFYLSRQKEVKKYVKGIGFKNMKHIKRWEQFSPFL